MSEKYGARLIDFIIYLKYFPVSDRLKHPEQFSI